MDNSGENQAITTFCRHNNIGFKITRDSNDDNESDVTSTNDFPLIFNDSNDNGKRNVTSTNDPSSPSNSTNNVPFQLNLSHLLVV